MERVVEPELMEDLEQAEAYANADFEEPHSRMIEKFKEGFPDFDGKGFGLDLGCGPADISVRMAKAFPRLVIHGVDGSEAMLEFGRKRITAEGLEAGIILYKGGILEVSLPRTSYDVILSNSLLHHLHEPEVLWQTIKRFGKDSALVFVMDLFRPRSEEEAGKIVAEYAAEGPEILRRDFYHSLLAAFTLAEVESQLVEADLQDTLKVERVSDHHLIVCGEL